MLFVLMNTGDKYPFTQNIVQTPGIYANTRARHVVGIDIEPRQIKAARKQARLVLKQAHAVLKSISEHYNFIVGSASSLPFPDRSFDTIYSHTLMSQIDAPIMVYREIFRVLKDGGVVGFREPYHAANVFINAPAREKYTELYGRVLKKNYGNVNVGVDIARDLHSIGFGRMSIEPVMSTTSSLDDRTEMAQQYADMTLHADFMAQAVELGWITHKERKQLAHDILEESKKDYGCISFCMIQTLAWK